MLTSVVWILAGITAWCVASLALALIVGPMVRSADRRDRGTVASPTGHAVVVAASTLPARHPQPITGAIPLQLAG